MDRQVYLTEEAGPAQLLVDIHGGTTEPRWPSQVLSCGS